MKETKKRNWTMVIYPDSLPSNWVNILIETGLPIAISPLHDKDLNADTEEHKKPHYHIIACYSGPTSFNIVNNLAKQLNAPIPKAIESVKGLYRYLTHQDNPEKYQYDKRDIKHLNGFDIFDFSDLTISEKNRLLKELQTFIRDNGIVEYAELLDLLLDNDMPELHHMAFNHTIAINGYLKSRRFMKGSKLKFSSKEEYEKYINSLDGHDQSDEFIKL